METARRDRTHVYQGLNAMKLEQVDELFQRVRAMTNGKELYYSHVTSSLIGLRGRGPGCSSG